MGGKTEVLDLRRALEKELSRESIEKARTLDILKRLSEVKMSLDLLSETKIGMTVNKLKKVKEDAVANEAKELVRRWKTVAQQEGVVVTPKGGGGGKSPKSEASTPRSEQQETVKPPLPPPASAVKRPVAPAPVKRENGTPSSSASPSPTASTTSATIDARVLANLPPLPSNRTKCREMLIRVFALSAGSQIGTAVETGCAVEKVMAQQFDMGSTQERREEYLQKFRQLHFNLKKNETLRESIRRGNVSARKLLEMSPEELATEEKRKELELLNKEAIDASRSDWERANEAIINKQCGIEGKKGMFKCGRCKSKHTDNYQKQTRSADEPMTVFVTCLDCGNRWKC